MVIWGIGVYQSTTMVQMCSITNTAHSFERRSVCRRFLLILLLLTRVSVSVFHCDGRSLVTTVLNQKGACNQGGKVLKFYYGGVTRRHSFGKCVLTTLLKKYIRKKTSSCDKVLFISPIRNTDRLCFQNSN